LYELIIAIKKLLNSLENRKTKNIMTPDEIFKNTEGQKHEVDIGIALIRIIELGCYNKAYLRSILKRQIETQELLKGATEINENILNKLQDLETNISELADKEYYSLIQNVLK
jgi:hypothetical protein